MSSQPRLLIVSPSWSRNWWARGKVLSPPLSLPVLASLTPPDVDVRLVDEHVETVDLQARADAVAITCITASAPRAYQIGDAFRERGIPVVMGGIHPSVMPDEASAHADAVVVGEAEPIWGQVVSDIAAGRSKGRYEGFGYAELDGLPIPRRDLLRAEKYATINVVQTARGCPIGCSFCSVSNVFGRRYRFRPVAEVVEEVASLNGRWIGFMDDNITGHHQRAKQLLEALIPLNIRWVGQGDLSIAGDPELLTLAARSGCKALFIGLESVSDTNLQNIGKSPNLDLDVGDAIGRIHRAGVEIIGSFVLGLDGDDLSVFKETVEFAEKHKLLAAQFAILTPFPGTAIRSQLEIEGRIEGQDWSRYTMSHVVFRPKQMTALQLQEGQMFAYRQFYSIPSILRRAATTRGKLIGRLLVNFSYRSVSHKKGLRRWLPCRRRTVVNHQ